MNKFEQEAIEEKCLSEWQITPSIRAEFQDRERYIAFKIAEAKGLVRIKTGGQTTAKTIIKRGY